MKSFCIKSFPLAVLVLVLLAALRECSSSSTGSNRLGQYLTHPKTWQRHAHVTLTTSSSAGGPAEKRFNLVDGPPPPRTTPGDGAAAVAPHVIAWAVFTNETASNGWNFLQVNSQRTAVGNDSDQVYAAGFLEGYITRDLITPYWNNMVGSWEQFCGPQPRTYCDRLNQTLRSNLESMTDQILTRNFPASEKSYWHQVRLVLEQISGLEDGYRHNPTSLGSSLGPGLGPRLDINPMGLYLLNLMGDLGDIQTMLNVSTGGVLKGPIHPPRSVLDGSGGHCSALIKLLPGSEDIFVSHVTWNTYSSMVRLIKQYDIPVSRSADQDSEVVPGQKWTFSSYPATILSSDDFYILSSGLSVLETTIGNGNDFLWRQQYQKVNESLWEFIRNVAANRLARSGPEWAEIFGRRNSGTYNNQFMVLDWKLFVPGTPAPQLPDGLLTVAEQLPLNFVIKDQTSALRTGPKNYWPSYNIPSVPEIFNLSGFAVSVDKYGDWFSYENATRAQIFRRDVEKVVDLESGVRLMRYNNFRQDPLARCADCVPPYSGVNAISSRADLNPPDGTYPWPALGHAGEGGIDMKATSYRLAQKFEFVAQGGPAWEQVEPFRWTAAGDLNERMRHEGQPDLWKFRPVHVRWTA